MFGKERTDPVVVGKTPQLALGLLVILTLGRSVNGAALNSQYGSRVWRTDEGLPHNCVQAVLQTRDGYIWTGTQYGLARFDGVRFVIFNRVNVPQMANANIVGLLQSRDGSLWISTGRGGVLRLKDGEFTHFGRAEGLADISCLGAMFESSDGALWFATLRGLSRYQDGKFTTFGTNTGLATDVVRNICEDKLGQIWFATPKGVYCWKNGAVVRLFTTADGLRGNDARAVFCDRDGVVWAGTGSGLSRIEDGNVTTCSMGAELANNLITHVYEDHSGTVWVGSYGGLFRYVDGKLVSQLDRQGLHYDMINSIFDDQEGNIWVGSRDGLVRLNGHRFTSYTQQQGLTCNNVMSVIERNDGTIWAATWGGGVNRLKDGVFSSLNHGPSALALALWEDPSNRLWAGTDWDGGLFQFDQQEVRHFAGKDGLTGGAVRVIYQDRSNAVWFGTTRGLYRMSGQKFTAFGVKHGMPAETIRAICEDDDGNLWVGTNDGLWQLCNGKFKKFTTADGLSNTTTGALHADHHGSLWIGTSGGGLNRFREGHFTAYTTRQGLFSDSVYEIVEDKSGWLWLTCQRGIFRALRSEFDRLDSGATNLIHCIAYGTADGLASEVCNLVAKPSAWEGKDGRLWFATTKGLSVIDPAAPEEKNLDSPPIVLERILADRNPFPAAEALPVSGPVRIPPGRGELEFEYTALTFRVPERTRFRYRLDPVDPDWVEAGSRRTAHYSNIYPGTYHFHVIARNSDNTWSYPGIVAEVVMLPHVWQTWSFKVAIGAVAVLGALGLHVMHLARVRALESLRLRLAADIHDEVGSNLSTISLLARKLLKGGTPKEAVEDVAAINRISGQTSSSIREIVWFINPENDTWEDLILRMNETAIAMLPGIECRFRSAEENLSKTIMPQYRQDLFLLYKEILANVAKHANASRVEIDIAKTDGVWQLTVTDNGIGFDAHAAHAGNGLKNMRLRATRLKGELKITSEAGRGTTVKFSTQIL